MIPNPDTNNETLCFVTIVFPLPNDNDFIAVKNKITSSVSELPQVKTEFRITEVRTKVPVNELER